MPTAHPTAPTVTQTEAEKMSKEIREAELALARNLAPDADALAKLISEAKLAKIHVALGYRTFAAYRREMRKELVKELHGQGVSNRVIAIAAGVTEGTVRNDLSGAQNYAPERTAAEKAYATLEGRLTALGRGRGPLDIERLKRIRSEIAKLITKAERKAESEAAIEARMRENPGLQRV